MVYNNKGEVFGFIFMSYIKISLQNTDHPELIEECKINLDKAFYKHSLGSGVDFLSLKKK